MKRVGNYFMNFYFSFDSCPSEREANIKYSKVFQLLANLPAIHTAHAWPRSSRRSVIIFVLCVLWSLKEDGI